MQSHFNSAALATLPQSELLALLSEYRARLNAAGEAEVPAIRSQINAIERALTHAPTP